MNGFDSYPPPPGPGGPPEQAPPPMAPPPGMPGYPGARPTGSTDNRAIGSLVLGIVATVLCCLPLIGPICGTIAIVLYAKFIGDFNASGGRLVGKGMAIAGLVTGIIGVAIGLIYTIYWLIVGSVMGSILGHGFPGAK
ncbi:MAG: DUF4190 domain-containing protein [Deltaproteobacteria bacterium]|nr:DUF4190 domain-containing protein [Deltaproteobacteria bacterium]